MIPQYCDVIAHDRDVIAHDPGLKGPLNEPEMAKNAQSSQKRINKDIERPVHVVDFIQFDYAILCSYYQYASSCHVVMREVSKGILPSSIDYFLKHSYTVASISPVSESPYSSQNTLIGSLDCLRLLCVVSFLSNLSSLQIKETATGCQSRNTPG